MFLCNFDESGTPEGARALRRTPCQLGARVPYFFAMTVNTKGQPYDNTATQRSLAA